MSLSPLICTVLIMLMWLLLSCTLSRPYMSFERMMALKTIIVSFMRVLPCIQYSSRFFHAAMNDLIISFIFLFTYLFLVSLAPRSVASCCFVIAASSLNLRVGLQFMQIAKHIPLLIFSPNRLAASSSSLMYLLIVRVSFDTITVSYAKRTSLKLQLSGMFIIIFRWSPLLRS